MDTLLNLPHVTVKQCELRQEVVFLHLELLNPGVSCPHCQHYTEELHQVRSINVRDLPISGHPVQLEIPRRQFFCNNCRHYFTEVLDYIYPKRRHTLRYEADIYQRVVATNIEQVGREEGLKYDRLKAMFDAVNEPFHKKNLAEGGTARAR